MTDISQHYADSCDNCMQPVVPAAAISDGDTGFVAGYRCPTCRAVWTCSWQTVPCRTTPPAPESINFLDRHLDALLHEQAAVNRAHKHLATKETP